jgi:hypothetical protein
MPHYKVDDIFSTSVEYASISLSWDNTNSCSGHSSVHYGLERTEDERRWYSESKYRCHRQLRLPSRPDSSVCSDVCGVCCREASLTRQRVCPLSSMCRSHYHHNNNSVALVRERTIPTERPLLVEEVRAKFFG